MAERAFIAEDNGSHARTVRRALLPRFQFVEAPDAPSARRLLRRRLDYSFLIFDIHLPDDADGGEGGLALFDEFHPLAPDALFILMSGDTRPRFVNYVHGKPRAKFVAKPFEVRQLRALGEEALTLRARRAPTSTETLEAIASWHLSATQRRVLACLLDGRTPEETRALLGLRERTYESHVRQILARAARTGLRFARILALVQFLNAGRASDT